MSSIRAVLLAVLMAFASIASAQAQLGNYFGGPGGALTDIGIPVQPNNTYLFVQTNAPCVTPSCNAFIPLSAFDGRFQGQIDALNGQISRSYQLIAASAAMKDAIPNYGDRFAIRINAAAFGGEAAGALGLSYNVNDMTRISVNYGQSRSQAIVSGGLNFSFR